MADTTTPKAAADKKFSETIAKTNELVKKRNRTTYDHVMSKGEKFALSLARNAKNAAGIIAERIQQGKGVSSEVLAAMSVVSGSVAGSIMEE